MATLKFKLSKLLLTMALLTLLVLTPHIHCAEAKNQQKQQKKQEETAKGDQEQEDEPDYNYDDTNDDEELFDKKSFLAEFNNAETKNKEVKFIKETFTSEATKLNREQYTDFVFEYLKWNVDEIMAEHAPEEEKDATHEHYKALALAFMENKAKKGKDSFDLGDVYRDVIAGRVLSYVHDYVDHESISEDNDLLEDEEL